jgi:hypothetical protein
MVVTSSLSHFPSSPSFSFFSISFYFKDCALWLVQSSVKFRFPWFPGSPVYKIVVGNLTGRVRRGYGNGTEMNHEEIEWGGLNRIVLLQDRDI